jgi:hypothetical protein
MPEPFLNIQFRMARLTIGHTSRKQDLSLRKDGQLSEIDVGLITSTGPGAQWN